MSISTKVHLFIIAVVLTAVMGTAFVAYWVNVQSTDQFYKSTIMSTASNVAAAIDADFVRDLQQALGNNAYQQLRARAEVEDNDELIADYLKNAGLYDKYIETIDLINTFQENMDRPMEIYLISIAAGTRDYFYLMSASSGFRLCYAGYHDVVESEFLGQDPRQQKVEPIISSSVWGWACSGYVQVCEAENDSFCFVGADIYMDDVMEGRNRFLLISAIGALILSFVVILIAVPLMNKTVIHPLVTITEKMKGFAPAEDADYEQAGVINLDIHSGDEIQDIYDGIHAMQVDIIDYLNHMSALRREQVRAYNDMRHKDEVIDKISRDAYRDALTGVNSSSAFKIAQKDMKKQMAGGFRDFAVLMMDVNDLKTINDTCGHKSGDMYIQGCCRMLCREFRQSLIYRIGGDEFAAILTGEDYKNRVQHIRNLREAYARTAAGQSSAAWQNFSAAVGSSACRAGDRSFEEVFKRADSDMYSDKKTSRKRK